MFPRCLLRANRYHFATLYDTHHRIAVYSAYLFQDSNGGGREKRWFVEPQVSTVSSMMSCPKVLLCRCGTHVII